MVQLINEVENLLVLFFYEKATSITKLITNTNTGARSRRTVAFVSRLCLVKLIRFVFDRKTRSPTHQKMMPMLYDTTNNKMSEVLEVILSGAKI